MENNDKEIKALDTYYQVANSEYDRIHRYFDQVDNKVGFLIAVVIGVPIAVVGFSSQLKSTDFNCWSLVFGSLGMIAFLGAGWNILRALGARKVKLGIPYNEFTQYCTQYEDKDMKEWVADILIKSSEFNYKEALQKAEYLKKMVPYLIGETIFFLAAVITILTGKL